MDKREITQFEYPNEYYEYFQDEQGNVYYLTTDVEQIIIQELYKAMKRNNEKADEIERLKSIINEAIEFIYDNAFNLERNYQVDDLWYEIPKLLEILDKGSDKE